MYVLFHFSSDVIGFVRAIFPTHKFDGLPGRVVNILVPSCENNFFPSFFLLFYCCCSCGGGKASLLRYANANIIMPLFLDVRCEARDVKGGTYAVQWSFNESCIRMHKYELINLYTNIFEFHILLEKRNKLVGGRADSYFENGLK